LSLRFRIHAIRHCNRFAKYQMAGFSIRNPVFQAETVMCCKQIEQIWHDGIQICTGMVRRVSEW